MSCSRATLAHIFFMLLLILFFVGPLLPHALDAVRFFLHAELYTVFLGNGRRASFVSVMLYFCAKSVGERQNDLHPEHHGVRRPSSDTVATVARQLCIVWLFCIYACNKATLAPRRTYLMQRFGELSKNGVAAK